MAVVQGGYRCAALDLFFIYFDSAALSFSALAFCTSAISCARLTLGSERGWYSSGGGSIRFTALAESGATTRVLVLLRTEDVMDSKCMLLSDEMVLLMDVSSMRSCCACCSASSSLLRPEALPGTGVLECIASEVAEPCTTAAVRTHTREKR